MEWLGPLKDVLGVLLNLAAIVIAIAAWLRKPGMDAEAAVKAMDEAQGKLHEEHRIHFAKIDERLKHLPTSDELAELEGTVKTINERTEGMADAIKGITRQLELIQGYLLNRKP